MTTAVPITCNRCHARMGMATVFYEGGNAYHFGCRPSQQTHVAPTASDYEHAGLLARIAELEAENAGLRSHQACTKRAEQAEAALAERTYRLDYFEVWFENLYPPDYERCVEKYDAYLKARAEEGSE